MNKKSILCATLVGGLSTATLGTAHAGATVSFGEDKSVSVGFGLRGSFVSTEDAAPNGTSRSSDFNIDSARLLLGASLSKTIKGTLNFDKDANDTIKVLDAYAQFEFMPEFNIWAGRHLSPGDRANMNGPYFLNASTYPGLVSQFPAIFAGRDNGVTAWGKLQGGHLNYSFGAFEGRNARGVPTATTSNQTDSLLYATRVAYHFLDPEPAPAYLTGSTYYGAADIFTVAVAAQYQKDGVGSVTVRDDYAAYTVDVLYEKRLEAGLVTLEAAAYDYDFSQTAARADVSGGVTAGNAYLVGGAFMFPQKVGIGKFAPFARYQTFDADRGAAIAKTKQTDVGVHYVIDGFNARLAATYSNLERSNLKDINSFILSYQFIY